MMHFPMPRYAVRDIEVRMLETIANAQRALMTLSSMPVFKLRFQNAPDGFILCPFQDARSRCGEAEIIMRQNVKYLHVQDNLKAVYCHRRLVRAGKQSWQ